ncbi:hypothetical protein A9F13_18g00869 [Clavispora lusitaniae]|uniref:Uncharacterized protein n=1 Tax=Clavispora lusitaniae TaxID=36911 RepID=A0AA91PWD6_CLALS|nr:hypothetical protein A9F13_18g00869 [Clavispora lusitaniae]
MDNRRRENATPAVRAKSPRAVVVGVVIQALKSTATINRNSKSNVPKIEIGSISDLFYQPGQPNQEREENISFWFGDTQIRE